MFGTATYQFSLRDHNDTYSLGAALNPAGPEAVREDLRYVSTPDSYLVNLGVGVPLRRLGVTAFMTWRAVGVPVHNVFGKTEGYRQPGYYVTAEPGVSWVMGRAAYSVSIPLRMWAGTKNNFLGQRAITLEGIHHAYGQTVVYRGIDFEAERGQRIVLVGPNGAGKSTCSTTPSKDSSRRFGGGAASRRRGLDLMIVLRRRPAPSCHCESSAAISS